MLLLVQRLREEASDIIHENTEGILDHFLKKIRNQLIQKIVEDYGNAPRNALVNFFINKITNNGFWKRIKSLFDKIKRKEEEVLNKLRSNEEGNHSIFASIRSNFGKLMRLGDGLHHILQYPIVIKVLDAIIAANIERLPSRTIADILGLIPWDMIEGTFRTADKLNVAALIDLIKQFQPLYDHLAEEDTARLLNQRPSIFGEDYSIKILFG